MAKRNGSSITGTFDGLTFYTLNGQDLIRKKGGPGKKQIKNDPAFEPFRKSQSEQTAAYEAVKLLRNSLCTLLGSLKYPHLNILFSHALKAVSWTDPFNCRGSRLIRNGDISLINGYNLNSLSSFSSIFKKQPLCNIDRPGGVVQVTVPAFNPHHHIVPAPGATVARLAVCAVEIDFNNPVPSSRTVYSADIPLTSCRIPETTLHAPLAVDSDKSVIVAVNIGFYKAVNGVTRHLCNREYNPVQILAAQHPATKTNKPGVNDVCTREMGNQITSFTDIPSNTIADSSPAYSQSPHQGPSWSSVNSAESANQNTMVHHINPPGPQFSGRWQVHQQPYG